MLRKLILSVFLMLGCEMAWAQGTPEAFIFPDYSHFRAEDGYGDIARKFESRGIRPVFVRIDWEQNNLNDYVNQARMVISRNRPGKVWFYGHGVGGIIALALSYEYESALTIVDDLDPLFSEDIGGLSVNRLKYWYMFGGAPSIPAGPMADRININGTPVVFLAGPESNHVARERMDFFNKKLNHSRVTEVETVKEDMPHSEAAEKLIGSIKIPEAAESAVSSGSEPAE